MDSRTTLPTLETATRATAPASLVRDLIPVDNQDASLVRDLIPVDNQDASLEQCAMTGRSPATIVTRAG